MLAILMGYTAVSLLVTFGLAALLGRTRQRVAVSLAEREEREGEDADYGRLAA